MKIEPHYETGACDHCESRESMCWRIHIPFAAGCSWGAGVEMWLCSECLKELREKIDALRLAIVTGENTK